MNKGEKPWASLETSLEGRHLPLVGCRLPLCSFPSASMNAYRREKLKEEKRISLERRRRQLQALLFEEREMLATELQALRLNKDTDLSKMRQKTEDLKSAREEQRKQIAEDRLYECWKKNSAKLREVRNGQTQPWGLFSPGREAAEREEESRTENEYEAARREALERLKEQEERRRQDRQRQAELLRQQVEELQLREAEAAKLKKEEENLLRQHWELEALEGERRRQEQNRKKIELGYGGQGALWGVAVASMRSGAGHRGLPGLSAVLS
uniref:Trichoplein keratin filament-binding protein n=1 Tax=Varanus komodoensis TaxID=61221 RepID=A0A8D2LVN2_VARKO